MRSDNQMTPRSPIAVFAYSILTLGIYQWYWLVKTKGELNRSQAKVTIPTAFVWLIPIVGGIWWYWRYAEAVDEVTHSKYSTPVSFLIIWLLSTIGCAIMQYAFNESHEQPIVTQPMGNTESGYNDPNQYAYAQGYSQPVTQPATPAPRYRADNPTHPEAMGQTLQPINSDTPNTANSYTDVPTIHHASSSSPLPPQPTQPSQSAASPTPNTSPFDSADSASASSSTNNPFKQL